MGPEGRLQGQDPAERSDGAFLSPAAFANLRQVSCRAGNSIWLFGGRFFMLESYGVTTKVDGLGGLVPLPQDEWYTQVFIEEVTFEGVKVSGAWRMGVAYDSKTGKFCIPPDRKDKLPFTVELLDGMQFAW